MVAYRADGDGEVGGQGGGCFGFAPDIGLHEEAVMHHRGAHLFVAGAGEEGCHVGMAHLFQEMAHAA